MSRISRHRMTIYAHSLMRQCSERSDLWPPLVVTIIGSLWIFLGDYSHSVNLITKKDSLICTLAGTCLIIFSLVSILRQFHDRNPKPKISRKIVLQELERPSLISRGSLSQML